MRTGAGYGIKQIRLLLLFLISSELLNVQTRSTDFVCNARVRRNMNNVKDLEVAMVGCSGSDQLPSPLQLPCVEILKASWDQKSLQQKHAEVRWALRVLLDSVGRMRSLAKLGCQSSLLERLEHRVKNHLHIVTDLETMGKEEATVFDVNPDCLSQWSNSLTQVLLQYNRLLRGKLEWLFLDLQNSCL